MVLFYLFLVYGIKRMEPPKLLYVVRFLEDGYLTFHFVDSN